MLVPDGSQGTSESGAAADGAESSEDDYVIRTEKLALTGGGKAPVVGRPASSGKGKGKGKGRRVEEVDGDDDGGVGEDLYD